MLLARVFLIGVVADEGDLRGQVLPLLFDYIYWLTFVYVEPLVASFAFIGAIGRHLAEFAEDEGADHLGDKLPHLALTTDHGAIKRQLDCVFFALRRLR